MTDGRTEAGFPKSSLRTAALRMLERSRGETRRIYEHLRRRGRALVPALRAEDMRMAEIRRDVETRWNQLSRSSGAKTGARIFIDGAFDNPNYWFRVSLVRAALGCAGAQEVGIYGQWRRDEVAATFGNFGVPETIDLVPTKAMRRRGAALANDLLATIRKPEDIIGLALPMGYPGVCLYDWLLKQQRVPVVRLDDPIFADRLAKAIAILLTAEAAVETPPDYLLTSHVHGLPYGAMTWAALRKGATVLNLAGPFGSIRASRLKTLGDIYRSATQATVADFAKLSDLQKASLSKAAAEYLRRRQVGESGDIGAYYAYKVTSEQKSRQEIASAFGWDPSRPIIAVYASQWFDLPHYFGMKNYRDFLDWIEIVVDAAGKNTGVNWLIKNHPSEDWYGGARLQDLLAGREKPHVRFVKREWNNLAVIQAVDAIVTLHGTIGVEAAAAGKPILVGDCGWYDSAGFAVVPTTRDDFVAKLGGNWWQGMDVARAGENALLFIGMVFCAPDWQKNFVVPDDSAQDRLYQFHREFVESSAEGWKTEVDGLRHWLGGDSEYYHIEKMGRAQSHVCADVPVMISPR